MFLSAVGGAEGKGEAGDAPGPPRPKLVIKPKIKLKPKVPGAAPQPKAPLPPGHVDKKQMEKILSKIQAKDQRKIFWKPVSDAIAPNYSSIIPVRGVHDGWALVGLQGGW